MMSTLLKLRFIIPAIAMVATLVGHAANTLTFSTPDTGTVSGKTSTVCVVRNTAGVTASYTDANPSAIAGWFTYGIEGAANARPLAVSRNGNTFTFSLSAEDMGVMIEYTDSRRAYFWIINYANHRFSIDNVAVSPESDCANALLNVSGSGEPIYYYEYNGIPAEISRDIKVTYTSLEFNEQTEQFNQTLCEETVKHLTNNIITQAPLCDTRFTVTGDRFLTKWGDPQSASSDYYNATAVDARTTATQTVRENDNEISVDNNELGGSAPVEITFNAVVSDAVKFTEWQFSRDPEFGTYDLRFTDPELTYVFEEYGKTYVRFQCANDNGSCDYFSETYTVDVSESRLVCPNAFSPNGDGVNDIWKVSYKSIVDFNCTIVNRNGVKIIEFNDPSAGWDGRYNGKVVPSGVYYYVIKATGSDGKNYKLAGDINIINYRQGQTTSVEE